MLGEERLCAASGGEAVALGGTGRAGGGCAPVKEQSPAVGTAGQGSAGPLEEPGLWLDHGSRRLTIWVEILTPCQPQFPLCK